MISQEIRRNFLKYFKDKGHAVVPSSSVIPHDDQTLLFTNAGMNQFKDVFLGKSKRDYTRAATSQKCIRVGGKHNDLDNVGHTARHLTFFEMLGNFSFGDYFKSDAIAYAWEVSTKIYTLDPEKIWITVFREDDEAFELWKTIVPEKKIVRMDEKDNFWAMGDTGPCGPCSELYFDRGEKYGSAQSPREDVDGTRYLEFWNLVFMQFNRDQTGKMADLPKQSIDTGSGLERVAALKLGVETVFATDVLRSLIAQIENTSGKKYIPDDPHLAPAFHVISDHIRSLAFAMADGAQPSNVERGYILRKLVRRAVRYGRMLGMQEPFLARILPRLIETMGPDYHELINSQSRIAEMLTLEEEAFIRTLKRGGNILNNIIEHAQTSANKQITGEEAFKLKDTYGFPLEEILLIAKDTGLQVNLDAYQLLEEQAKERSRVAKVVHVQEVEESLFKNYVEKHGTCTFLGYDSTSAEGTIMALVVNGIFVDAMEEGQEGMVILNRTPFYAEKGGQVGDIGILSHHQAHFDVTDCYTPYSGVILHVGRLEKGARKSPIITPRPTFCTGRCKKFLARTSARRDRLSKRGVCALTSTTTRLPAKKSSARLKSSSTKRSGRGATSNPTNSLTMKRKNIPTSSNFSGRSMARECAWSTSTIPKSSAAERTRATSAPSAFFGSPKKGASHQVCAASKPSLEKRRNSLFTQARILLKKQPSCSKLPFPS
jgi:alanyl-tRNA synthetase